MMKEDDNGAGVGAIPIDVKAPESTYLLFAEPLLNDKGPTVASAIQSIILYPPELERASVKVPLRPSSPVDVEIRDTVASWSGSQDLYKHTRSSTRKRWS